LCLDAARAFARVTVVDVDMSIRSMASFLIKLTLAAIPALLVLGVIGGLLAAVFSSVFGR
jgi:hypothetical protein